MQDPELIDAALAATADLPQTKAADRLGVSQRQVSRWRAGERTALQDETRQKLEGALREGAKNGKREAPATPTTWGQAFLEVLVLESRAADNRARAAASWARWMEQEATNAAGRAAAFTGEASAVATPPPVADVREAQEVGEAAAAMLEELLGAVVARRRAAG